MRESTGEFALKQYQAVFILILLFLIASSTY
jgi:hypothetical protein